MHNLKLYKENPSIFQKYIALTNQKQILIDKVLTEFEKYRVKQDKLYKSDFDLLMEECENYSSEE